MSFGESVVARLAEAAAAGQDGIVVVFPNFPEVRIPGWIVDGDAEPPKAILARREIAFDPEWRF